MDFLDRLISWIRLIEHTLTYPTQEEHIAEWSQKALALADGFDLEDEIGDEDIDFWIDRILTGYEMTFRRAIGRVPAVPVGSVGTAGSIRATIDMSVLDALCNRTQTEQRTPAWYEQMRSILSASELGGLYGSPRLRAQLVMSKVNPVPRLGSSLAVPSANMGPFDWGIRFEPVVKQIYCYKYGTEIKELGRLLNPRDPRCSASPDGLIYSDPTHIRTGRLIEIKCPVTRIPDGKVPKDYYNQMQMQLHVTGLQECEYVEAVFTSPYSSPLKRPPLICSSPNLYGEIVLVQTRLESGQTECRYEYGPVCTFQSGEPLLNLVLGGLCPPNSTVAYIPTNLRPNDTIIERIPWSLYRWDEQTVTVSEEWWQKIVPIMDAFWVDVEKAKADPTHLQEHLQKKEEKCAIRLKTQEVIVCDKEEEVCRIRLGV